jgi:hypothetical protein
MEGAVSLELDNDGPFSPRRSQDSRGSAARRRDDAPAWPVLARLPRVDASGAAPPRAPLPTFAPEAIGGEEPLEYLSEPPLKYVGEPLLRYADKPHPAQRHELHVAPAAEPAPTIAFKPPSQQLSSSRRYRIDAGDAADYAPRPHRQRADDQPSLSDAIFRAHAALAPHMGLVSAAALLLAVGFLYWLAIGRQGAVAPPIERLPFGVGLTHDVPTSTVTPLAPAAAPHLESAATPEASASAMAEPRIDAPAIEWTTPPRVAEAPVSSEPATSPSISAPAKSPRRPGDSIQGPASMGPALAPPAPSATPSDSASAAVATPQATHPAAELDNGITPTPELDAYPSTPFPAFSFVDQTPAAGAPAVATAPNAAAQR